MNHGALWVPEVLKFEFHEPVLKKVTTASDRKGAKTQHDIS